MILVSAQALAQAETAPVLASPMTSSQDQLIQVCIALVAVLALIYALAWFVKRKQGMHGTGTLAMKTIAVLPMGVKEKIVLVEVGGKQILLGMTPSNINTLATFDEPIIHPSSDKQFSFAQKLKDILHQQNTHIAATQSEQKNTNLTDNQVKANDGD
ncbi:MAG: flagellar biosynthetic protein FliO [Gammaproteobacteria bacterium]|nr:flagellar biosynthetic protein FliO [Gammaproteobacteria bacterium]